MRNLLILIFALLILNSCGEDIPITNPDGDIPIKLDISKIEFANGDIQLFEYNDKDFIETVKYYENSNNEPLWFHSFTYVETGAMTSMLEFYIDNKTSTEYRTDYIYNYNTIEATKYEHRSGEDLPYEQIVLEYGAHQELLFVQVRFPDEIDEFSDLNGRYDFIWGVSNNFTKVEYYLIEDSEEVLHQTIEIEYDSMKNPYFDMNCYKWILNPVVSKNNPIKIVKSIGSSNSERTFVYTYNSSNYPITFIEYVDDVKIREAVNIIYE